MLINSPATFAQGNQDFSYGGIYSFGTTPDSGRTGWLWVYPNSDSTNLFYLELNRGAPSYNRGQIVGQMNIYNSGEADFTLRDTSEYLNCSMNFWFINDSVYIRTNDNADDCHYGHAVYSHGDFKLRERAIPKYFIELPDDTISFKLLDWEKWWE